MAQNATKENFLSVFPVLVKDLLNHAEQHKLPREYVKWYKTNLEANMTGGKCNRGMSVPDSVYILLGRPLSEEEYFQAATLGWMIEFIHGFLLVSSDIMDASISRRGKPCWYRHEEVGLLAINDSMMLESAIYTLLKRYFRSHPAYLHFLELFQEITYRTGLGRLADQVGACGSQNMDKFNMKEYHFIACYKTAYYSFYLPVALALHQLNIGTAKNLQMAERILVSIGEYSQIQNDYLDSFGLQHYTTKTGTNIMNNKCSWLICQACRCASPQTTKTLIQSYGRKDIDRISAVESIYEELGLENSYQETQNERLGKIRELISDIDQSDGLKEEVFEAILDKVSHERKQKNA